jgi:hypothetical protein
MRGAMSEPATEATVQLGVATCNAGRRARSHGGKTGVCNGLDGLEGAEYDSAMETAHRLRFGRRTRAPDHRR